MTHRDIVVLAFVALGSGGMALAQGCGSSSAAASRGGAGAGTGGEGAGTGGESAGTGGSGPVCSPPAEKLRAWLKLDDGAGSTATDSSGNGNDATFSGADAGGDAGPTAWTTGILGGALSLDGTDRLIMAHDIIGADAVTFCAWYDTTTAPWGATLVSNGVFGVTVGTGAFTVSSDGTHGAQSGPIALPPTAWSHVCVTRDATGTASFFINGEASGGGDSGPTSVSTSPVTLGNHPYQDYGWQVELDDVRIYSGILTLSEIQCLYLAGEANPHPQTITAASCAEADVQGAVDQAKFADTVAIPAGTCTWTSTLTVQTPLTLQGAGLDKTVIVDGVDFTSTVDSHAVLDLAASFRGPVRATGFTIDGGTGPDDAYNKGMLSIDGSGGPWRVDHVRFHANRTSAVYVYASGGVLDHDVFDLDGWHFGIYGFNGGDAFGDPSWAQPLSLGGPDAYFVEDNQFTEVSTATTPYSVASDGWTGQRVLFRHNTLTDTIWGNHGTESSGLLRGARSFEIYANTLTYTVPSSALPYAIEFRSGNGVLFGNVMTGLAYGALYTDNYRDWSPFAPWGECDGTSPYDQNDPMTYDTGTETGSDGTTPTDNVSVLTDSTKSWTPNQWVGYSVHDTTRGDSSIIVSNTATTLTARWDNTHNPIPLSFAMGDAYVIQRAKVCLDQMGRGAGQLMTRDTSGNPTMAAWPQQALEPTYVWGNTSGGKAVKLASGSPHIVDGTDVVNDACPAGYTPYTYPHPITGAPPATQTLGCP